MTTHTLHDDILTHGLDPACLRCAEIAENPGSQLDQPNLLRLSIGDIKTPLDEAAARRLRLA